jgi:hypothetical protein
VLADDEETNEIIDAARAHKRHSEAAADKPEPSRKRNWDATAIGVGVGAAIGSAALTAALLFANRGKKK